MAAEFDTYVRVIGEPVGAQGRAEPVLTDHARRLGLHLQSNSPGALQYRPAYRTFVVMFFRMVTKQGLIASFTDDRSGETLVHLQGKVGGSKAPLVTADQWAQLLGGEVQGP